VRNQGLARLLLIGDFLGMRWAGKRMLGCWRRVSALDNRHSLDTVGDRMRAARRSE